MANKITLLDGAVGTSLWELADQNGIARTPVWKYNIEQPALVSELCRRYIDAGAEILLTNTFGANRQMVERSSKYTVEQVVSAGAGLALEAVKGTSVRLALACGPLLEFMEPYGDLEEEEVEDIFTQQLEPGIKAGIKLVMVQTFMDLATARVATRVAKRLGAEVFTTLTFEKSGRTMMGNTIEQAVRGLEDDGAAAVGMNCSLGPNLALPIISEFKQKTDLPLVFKPNAGLPVTNPDGSIKAPYSPKLFAEEVAPALEFVSYIGGCCNCNPEYIKELKKLI